MSFPGFSVRASFLPSIVRVALLLVLLSASPGASALVGCPWMTFPGTASRGIIDRNATYWTSLMPNQVAPGTMVQVDAQYPQLRFFNFTIYHDGKMIDYLSDAALYPLEGGTPEPNIADIPYSNGYTDHYRLKILFEDPPAPPATRAPNTLYAGANLSLARLLIMRGYLPVDGSNAAGGVALPELQQINPDGSVVRFDRSSSNLGCPLSNALAAAIDQISLPEFGVAPSSPAFTILSSSAYDNGNALYPAYADFDAGYAYLVSNPQFADLLLIRQRLPATPSQPVSPANLRARYVSVCGYRAANRQGIGCVSDADMTVQADGYSNIVISTPASRPPLADPGAGYDWLPWAQGNGLEVFVIRQLMATPSFVGNLEKAGGTPDPAATLGAWAPQATYCDLSTFNVHAADGGAAVFSACRASAAASATRPH